MPISESITFKKPVIVPDQGGHIDYIDPEAAFFTTGSWEPCHILGMFYDSTMDWYEPSVKSIRKQLRLAYTMWKNEPEKLKAMGQKGFDKVTNGDYSYEKIGMTFVNIIKEVLGE